MCQTSSVSLKVETFFLLLVDYLFICFTFSFVVALKGIYSNFFVFQVLSSVVLYIAELTPIILDSSDISDVFKNVCISTACIGQFCLYCIPAAEITAEVNKFFSFILSILCKSIRGYF